MNKTDGGAVHSFRLQEILNNFAHVSTGIVMIKAPVSQIDRMFAFLMFIFFFIFETKLYL